jgi:hypothetical protein
MNPSMGTGATMCHTPGASRRVPCGHLASQSSCYCRSLLPLVGKQRGTLLGLGRPAATLNHPCNRECGVIQAPVPPAGGPSNAGFAG